MTGEAEYPFSSGWYGRSFLQNAVLGAISDVEGTGMAIISAVALPSKATLQINWLRHRHNTSDTALQFLLANLAEWAKQNAFSQLNFGLSTLLSDESHLRRNWSFKLIHLVTRQRQLQSNMISQLATIFNPYYVHQFIIIPGPSSVPTVNNAIRKLVGNIL